MRLKFEFDLVDETIKLPINYNRYLRDLIYALLADKLEDFQPDTGEPFESKHFSMFHFSKIYGDFQIIKEINNQKNLVFNSSIKFFLGAPYEDFLREFVKRMPARSIVQLGRGELCLASLQILPEPKWDKTVTLIRALSPIAVPDPKQDGNRPSKKDYLSPNHPEFSKQIRLNLLKKYHEVNGGAPKDQELTIKPHLFSEKKKLPFRQVQRFCHQRLQRYL